jgi:DNA-binding XRE family transcriptional regulator
VDVVRDVEGEPVKDIIVEGEIRRETVAKEVSVGRVTVAALETEGEREGDADPE